MCYFLKYLLTDKVVTEIAKILPGNDIMFKLGAIIPLDESTDYFVSGNVLNWHPQKKIEPK